MKNKLPALTALLLIGVATAFAFRRSPAREDGQASGHAPATPFSSATPPSPTAGDQLLVQARLQLERRLSVTARIRYQATLPGRSLAGFGGYWQQGRGENMHLRFELRVNHDNTSLLQVSDGRFIWTDQQVPAGRSITRLDLRRVRSETSRPEDDLGELLTSGIRPAMPEPELTLRTGGLPMLLKVLGDCFNFVPPQSMRWTPAQPLEGLPATIPVFAVVGRWKPEMLAFFVPAGKDATALPDRLPQEVLLLFGQADLFPYRLEFRRKVASYAANANSPLSDFALTSDPLMLLELSAVSFDSQVPAGQFDYLPGAANWVDHTSEYIEVLKKQRAERMAIQKRALQR